MVKAVTVLGFAIPVVGYLFLVQHYSVNAIVGDQWDDVWVIRQSYLHGFDWSSLWAVHTDNRILFPNLIVVALAHTVHFNVRVEEYLSAVMLFAATGLFIWSHKRRSPNTPLIFYCPFAFLVLSLAQFQNTLWAFQMAWYLVLLCFALAIVLLDRPTFAWPYFLAAALVAVVASYSSLQGLLIWPAGLVLLYHRRRPLWVFVCWTAAAGTATALYFYNFKTTSQFNFSSRYAWHHPLLVIKSYLYALGEILAVPLQLGAGKPPNAAVMAFGILILALAVFVLIVWGVRRDVQGGRPVGITLIVFGLLFDASVSVGRIWLGIGGAAQSRYTTYDLLVLGGIYLTVLGMSPELVGETQGVTRVGPSGPLAPFIGWLRNVIGRIDRRAVLGVALAAIVIQIAVSVPYGLKSARGEHQQYVTTASVTRNIDHESDITVRWILNFSKTAPWLRAQAHFLRQHHLSQFG